MIRLVLAIEFDFRGVNCLESKAKDLFDVRFMDFSLFFSQGWWGVAYILSNRRGEISYLLKIDLKIPYFL